MITLYPAETRNFAGNGLMDVEPYCTRCDIMEEMNGNLTADIEIAPFPRMDELHSDMVLRIPSPVRETPYLEVAGTPAAPGTVEKVIWKVNVTTDTSRKFTYIYSKPAWDYEYALKRLYNGTEYEYLGATSSRFHRAIAPDGTTGYILTGDGEFSRNIESGGSAAQEGYVVESKQTRDQLFRIMKIVPSTNGITIFARHITDDLRDNYVGEITAENATGAALGAAILENAMDGHAFNIFSDVDAVYTGKIGEMNPLRALIDKDAGLTCLIGGEVLRDNFDIYYAKAIGRDRGASIEYGKNAVRLEIQTDEEGVCTRVIPLGYDQDNNPITLPEVYVDSPRAAAWGRPRGTQKLDLREVKIGDQYADNEQIYAALREKALEYFETGVDRASVSAHAEYVDLSRTNAAGRGPVSYVYLGDTVTLKDSRYGYNVKAQVVSYVFDALNRIYRSLSFGTPYASISNIRWPASSLKNGSISAVKLMAQSVTGPVIGPQAVTGGKIADKTILARNIAAQTITGDLIAAQAIKAGNLAAGAVTAEKIESGSISTDKLAAGAVTADKLQAKAVTAEKIDSGAISTDKLAAGAVTADKLQAKAVTADKLAAGAVTADKLQAGAITAGSGVIADAAIGSAQIALLAVKTGNIDELAVTTAKIAQAAITEAKIANAAITSAKIKDAAIDTAKIALGAITQALIQQGAVGTVQIKDGSITDAKIVELTANKINAGTLSVERLVIVGSDKSIVYAINQANGTAQLSQTTIDGGALTRRSITADRIVAESITSDELAANSVTANKILAGAITAEKLAALCVTADKIAAGAITVDKIESNVGSNLDISANKSIKLMAESIDAKIGAISVGGRNLIRNSEDLLFENYYFTGALVVTHDGAGNVTVVSGASAFAGEDGHVTIKTAASVSHDGAGNVTITG